VLAAHTVLVDMAERAGAARIGFWQQEPSIMQE
jgi:hypothetical protein